MNRKVYTSIVVAVVCLAFGLLTGCSSSSAPVIAISATAGSGQSQTVGEAFATALEVTVTSNGNPASGVTVTFSAPSSGASCTPATASGTTGSDGTLSTTCTANTTAGGYSVTATATGATSTASFTETNVAPSVFVYYVSGLENINLTSINDDPNPYVIAGAVAFDLSGNVLGGEQDYNDGVGLTSPGEPTTADTISATGSSMTVSSTTGTGTLVLVSSNTNVGVAGTETFAVQFINSNHALITQFDGSATSSGSFDLQSAIAVSGNYAFTVSGVDPDGDAFGYGGIFADASGAITGTIDENDEGTLLGTTFSATDNGVPSTDAYGRGTISGFTDPISTDAVSLAYYVVGPEAVRIVDVDTTDIGVGSAYGQGASPAFDSTALGTADVFALQNNSWGYLFATVGNIVPSGAASGVAAATFAGEGDDDEEGNVLATASATTGDYTIATTGYGQITNITGLGDVTTLGIYATDPALNLLDPNNTSGGGGALVLEQDATTGPFWGGTGIIVPQGTTTSSDFNGLSYGFGAQAFTGDATLPTTTDNVGWEFDFVGQGTYDTTLDVTGTASISDPFGYFVAGAIGEYSGIAVAGTAAGPDDFGRYTYPVNPFAIGPVVTGGTAVDYTTVLYEASPAYTFSIDEDDTTQAVLWVGTYQEQTTSGAKAFMRGKKAATTAPKSKTTKK